MSGLEVDRERGGQGLSYFCKLRVAEVMARVCFSSTFALNNSQAPIRQIAKEGSERQSRRYLDGLLSGELVCAFSLTEPGTGSDFAAIAMKATKVPGGWTLNGSKTWVTNGAHADLLILYAQTDSGSAGIASFLVDLHSEGVVRENPYELMGGHAIGACTINFFDVFVGDEDLFAPAGVAFKRALLGITRARTHVAAMTTAIVSSSLERAVTYAGERQTFGKRLIDHQGLRWSLSNVATEFEAARALTYRSARLIANEKDATLAAAQAKLFAVDVALRGVAACMQVMGALGLKDDEPFCRHLASARIAAYVDGTSEMQIDRIGALLSKSYGSPSVNGPRS